MARVSVHPPLPIMPAEAVQIGPAAALVEDTDGGRVFVHGMLVFAWDGNDEAGRRLAAVQLVELETASVADVTAGFGVGAVTLWRWRQEHDARGVAGLVPQQRGPKGPSKLTAAVVADVRARRRAGESLRVIAARVAISTGSVRNALRATDGTGEADESGEAAGLVEEDSLGEGAGPAGAGGDPVPVPVPVEPVLPVLPVLPEPVSRMVERGLARAGLLTEALPVFHPAGRVGLVGLFLAFPGLAATGLLDCAKSVYGQLPAGFYGLDSMLIEGVLRCLAAEPRAEGATRIDPFALGRVLGLDRAPEVKTIRRRIGQLAAAGRAEDLLAAMATRHVARHHEEVADAGILLYVDGHVRAYQGTRRIARTHAARLRFPAPATVETWICDNRGDPVLVVMAEPAASLAGELRRLLPTLREAVGDDRRVLVGFDRGGWSPALFQHMFESGFDPLTWRKHPAPDLPPAMFTEVTFTDEAGIVHTWQAADTQVDLPVDDHGGMFTMRQITKLNTTRTGTTQAHVVTTRTDLTAGEVLFRMGSRWRLENYFRYARMHFALDSHDTYQAGDDDPNRMVPNPAKTASRDTVNAARARLDRVHAHTDALLLAWRSPQPGQAVTLANSNYNQLTAGLRDAETALATAQARHAGTPARLPLAEVNPGQQVLDTETKLVTHAIRIAAFNTITGMARDLRVHTDYARADQEAHTLIRQALTSSGDIIPSDGVLTIQLDPLPTRRATHAISELCQHLNNTNTRYPGTPLQLRYKMKTRD